MEIPTCDAALQAIHILYGVANSQEKESAAKWLEQLQKSVYAWKVLLFVMITFWKVLLSMMVIVENRTQHFRGYFADCRRAPFETGGP